MNEDNFYNEHKVLFDLLSNAKGPKKEIGVAQLALQAASMLKKSNTAAYEHVRAFFRELEAAGHGTYVEGRRGHGSRFKAENTLQGLAEALAAPPLTRYSDKDLWNELLRREGRPLD